MSLFRLAAHFARQSQTNNGELYRLFSSRVGLLLLEIEREKEAHSTRSRVVVCASLSLTISSNYAPRKSRLPQKATSEYIITLGPEFDM